LPFPVSRLPATTPPTLTSALGIGTYTAMSDAEYALLAKEIGHVEANRRRIIRAQLARERAESEAREAANNNDATEDADSS
jgi:adenine-specific DNA glycosylase